MMAVKLLLLLTLFYMSQTAPDLRANSANPKNFRTTPEDVEANQDTPTSPSTSANPHPDLEKLGSSPDDDNHQHSKDFPDSSHGSPTTMQRKATRGKRKIHRAVGWLIGTGLTLASILVLIAGMALTSRGTNTDQEEVQNNKGRW